MKTSVIVTICSIVVGCASPSVTSRRADTPAAVALRTEQLSAEFERVERQQTSGKLRHDVHTAHVAWLAYMRANRRAESEYAARGITLGRDYYRLQNRFIDTQFTQLHSLQQPFE